jgi:hypothetical protein
MTIARGGPSGLPRRRHAVHHGFEDLVDALARLGRAGNGVAGVQTDHFLDLAPGLLRVGLRQVHLVEHRHDLDAEFERGVAVGHRLRLDALAGIDHQQRALAGRKRAAHLVAEVDVARRVDEVELVEPAVARRVLERRRLRLDGDAALALDVHRVEHLLVHLALGQTAAALDQAIGQRALAVVDVGNDGEVADVVHRERTRRRAAARLVDARRAALGATAMPASRCERRRQVKKRRVQGGDAPSNRTFGNCLLGTHCSQNNRPGTRANA